MTTEKAIEILRGYINYAPFAERFKEAMECGKDALEKQIIKPLELKAHKDHKTLGKNYYCSCGVLFMDWENQPTNYCGNCGQKLVQEAEE